MAARVDALQKSVMEALKQEVAEYHRKNDVRDSKGAVTLSHSPSESFIEKTLGRLMDPAKLTQAAIADAIEQFEATGKAVSKK